MLTARTLWESMLSCSELELHLKAYYDSTGQYCPPEQYPRISGHGWEVLPESGTSRSHMAASPMLSELPEDLYFRNSLQVRILRHFRYMYTPDHSHAFFEMIYVLKGSCSNQVDGLGLPLSEGDICIIPPRVIHSIAADGEAVILNVLLRASTFTETFSSLLKNTSILSEFFNEIVYSSTYKKYLLFRTGQDCQLVSMILEMFAEQENQLPYYENILNGSLVSFLGKLLQRHEASVEYPDSYMERFSSVPRITSHIRRHCTEITLESCARTFHFNPQYLSSLLKKHTGKTFSTLLAEARMERAALLLRESDISIHELGTFLGYSDSAYFMKVFKKHYGCTPSDYRRQTAAPHTPVPGRQDR